jgi:hypothetical protein
MERRLDLLLGVFARASTACGIKFAEGASIPDCADQIIRAAKGAKLMRASMRSCGRSENGRTRLPGSGPV